MYEYLIIQRAKDIRWLLWFDRELGKKFPEYPKLTSAQKKQLQRTAQLIDDWAVRFCAAIEKERR